MVMSFLLLLSTLATANEPAASPPVSGGRIHVLLAIIRGIDIGAEDQPKDLTNELDGSAWRLGVIRRAATSQQLPHHRHALATFRRAAECLVDRRHGTSVRFDATANLPIREAVA